VTGERLATVYLFQRLSVVIQRGNYAAAVLGTMDLAADKLVAVFYLVFLSIIVL